MKFYFDASALTKRYVSEPESGLVDGLFLEAESIVVGSISFAEVISALTRLRRENKLSASQYGLCKRAVVEDFALFEICHLSEEVLQKTVEVFERGNLRASDAIQVASAIQAGAERFISGDTRQIETAKKFNLQVTTLC